MDTLKIQIPEGFKVASFDEKTGTVKFAPLPKDIKERIKTFGDALSYHGTTMSDFILKYGSLEEDEQAYIQVKLIVAALNEGWVPDWSNSNQPKFYPWFEMGSPSGVGFSYYDFDYWLSYSLVGSRLCFKSRELAEYAGKQFTEIYKVYLTLK